MARVSDHIYYDIFESDLSITYKDLIMYFSSEFNLTRFQNKILNFIKEENSKLKVKYNVEVEFDEMLIIAYYKKIEKRGFRVYKKINYIDGEFYLQLITDNDIIKSKVGEKYESNFNKMEKRRFHSVIKSY